MQLPTSSAEKVKGKSTPLSNRAGVLEKTSGIARKKGDQDYLGDR